MKTSILTTALVLVSIVSVLAQEGRPGQPIKGVIVKGGSNPGPKSNFELVDPSISDNESFDDAAMGRPGQPIGGIVVKGGQNPRPKGNNIATENPLFDHGGHTAENPLSMKAHSDMGSYNTNTNPYYVGGELAGENSSAFTVDGGPIGGIIVKGGIAQARVAGNPIGGIIVKGAKAETALNANPLYTGSGTQGSNPLYKGKD